MGSMWLGVRCLELIKQHPDLEVVGVCVPPSTQNVWWTDVVDEEYVGHLGFRNSSGAEVMSQEPDLVFSVLNGYLYSVEEIAAVSGGIVNLHPAPLPSYRGMNAYPHAIMNGEDFFGATLHYVDAGIDTGAIIGRSWTAIDENETGKSLYRKTMPGAFALFERHLHAIVNAAKNQTRVPTITQIEQHARYYRRTSIADKTLDGLTEHDARLKARALTFEPHLPPYFDGGPERRYVAFDRSTSRFIEETGTWSAW